MSKVVGHEGGLVGGFRNPRREWSDREDRGGGFWVDRAMTEAPQAGQGAERRQPHRWKSMSKDLEVRGCLASLPSAWPSAPWEKGTALLSMSPYRVPATAGQESLGGEDMASGNRPGLEVPLHH